MLLLLKSALFFDKAIAFVGRLGAWLIFPLMGAILFDVIMRRWFNIGSTMLQELEWHFHGALFLLLIAWGYNKGIHVRIELLHNKFSLHQKVVVELLGCLFFLLPYVGAVVYFGYDYTVMSFSNSEISASGTGLAYRWFIKSILVFGIFLLGIAALSRIIKALVWLTGDEKLKKLSGLNAMSDFEYIQSETGDT